MTQEIIQQKLRSIISPYIQNETNFKILSPDSEFIRDLEINSANLVDIILDVEDEFDIELNDQDMENMLTVKASVEIIEKKLSEK